MSKINIRESLNRLDLQTDNKYDLRNTYDCSNISDDKKKKLAEALNKNASAKTISRILDESYGGYDYYLIEFFVDGRRYEEEYTDTSAKEALERFKEDYSDDDYKIREIYKLTDEGYTGLGYPFIRFNESLNEEVEEQLYKVVIQSGATKRDFESALYEDEAEEIVDYYGGRWIDENGFEWDMYVEEDDDSTEHAMVDNSYDMEDDYKRTQRECVESLNEANYGGAYDIDPEMFWTKDDLIEFSDAVCDKLAEKFGYQYDIADVGAESNNDMYITIMDTTHDIEADVSFRIKMSRIRSPRDLMKYLDTVVSEFVKKFEEEYQYYEFDESLKEDIDDFDPKYNARYEVNSYYGNNYRGLEDDLHTSDFEEVKDWVWEKIQKGGYIEVSDRERGKSRRLDPDNYDWESDDAYRVFDDLEELSPLNEEYESNIDNSQYLDTNDLHRTVVSTELSSFLKSIEDGKSWDEALVNLGYECVDPGCTSWSKETEDGEIYVSFENLDDESKIENSKISFTMFDKNDDVVEEDSFDFRVNESLKEGLSEISDDFSFARSNWDKLNTGVSFDDALEEYNNQYGEEHFYAKPLYVKSAWDTMVSMFTESLKEAVEDEVEFDEFEETDFNDEEVDEGVNFFEGGEEWTWEERVAGPVNIDFDNWSVWKAKKAVDIRDFIIGKNERGGYIIDEEPFYKAHEDSERAYFVVDEDTGFIDWGPVENRVEAQDFLNGKISDWEEETGFRHPMHNDFFDESLKESKDIEDTGYSVVLHYDDIGGGEEYDYEASWDDVVEVLRDVAHSNGDGPEDANEDEYLEWVMDNFDELSDRYESNVLNYFESEASQYEYDHRNDEP